MDAFPTTTWHTRESPGRLGEDPKVRPRDSRAHGRDSAPNAFDSNGLSLFASICLSSAIRPGEANSALLSVFFGTPHPLIQHESPLVLKRVSGELHEI